MVGDTRQGWALIAAMTLILVAMLGVCYWAESGPNPLLWGIRPRDRPGRPGTWKGKEMRFGVANSALWATVTTSASNGSVNAMHDSFTPLGGMIPLIAMHLGEVVFGGVGSGFTACSCL
jgi:K+-transporting ATPase ATPase A chain